jgi:hypothetical protein
MSIVIGTIIGVVYGTVTGAIKSIVFTVGPYASIKLLNFIPEQISIDDIDVTLSSGDTATIPSLNIDIWSKPDIGTLKFPLNAIIFNGATGGLLGGLFGGINSKKNPIKNPIKNGLRGGKTGGNIATLLTIVYQIVAVRNELNCSS